MAGSQCYIGKFQETCGGEPTQISHLRLNSANENAKKHCGALDALKQAVGIETDCEDANDGKCIAEAIKRKVGNVDGMDDGFIHKVFENGESDLVKTQCELLSMDLECIEAADK